MISTMMQNEIDIAAKRYNLPRQLIAGIILTESGGDLYAYKTEPAYRYLVDITTGRPFRSLTPAEIASETAPADFPHLTISSRDTEWWGQQASWGPMQVMGAVARELGYLQPFPALCSLAYGIDIGCHHLATLRDRFLNRYGWRGVAASYNAGIPREVTPGVFTNQEYVDRVARNHGFEALSVSEKISAFYFRK